MHCYDKKLVVVDIDTMTVTNKFTVPFKTGFSPAMISDPNDNELIHIIKGSEGRIANITNGRITQLHMTSIDNLEVDASAIVYIQHNNIFIYFRW